MEQFVKKVTQMSVMTTATIFVLALTLGGVLYAIYGK